ncbi:SDR family oxidoreductase [Halorubrum sp. CBA1125]|uniref:SDR family NAD(P)-dependent oxidoreductase n=1 Tax=Halorubrum sp. CBA1125 TaxID=2668072 RepID=UPI002AA2A586|nr:SDR family oxidoreductase [Halorubrum sp. CBA1125]
MPLEYTHRPVTVTDKTAVVIGGTSGIGRAIALGFAEEGADVVAASRTESSVAATAEEIRERGGDTIEATCDVTDSASIAALRDAVVDAFGGVDILVNSPSSIARTPVAEITDEDWETVMSVQLRGPVEATKLFAERMESGAVINISSASAEAALPNLAVYSTAKGGIDAFTRVAAEEYGPEIRVNAIRPGFVLTEQTDGVYTDGDPRYETIKSRTTGGRLAQPEEIAGAAVYLASDAASYTTGEILTVDDGFLAATFEE